MSKDELLELFQTRAIDNNWRLQFTSVLQLIVAPVYIFFALLMLNKHEKKSLNIFSEPDKIDLRWLKVLLWSFGIIWLIISVNIFIYEFSQLSILIWAHYTFTILFAIFIFFIGYQGIKKANIFADVKFHESSKKEKSSDKKETPISEYDDKLIRKLENHIIENKPHLKSTLTISELASEIDTQPHTLSSLLNNKLSKNFFDYVNHYRIDEFKERLKDHENRKYTILALAFDCGFNSKSSFNRIFKNYEGITPTEYQKKLNF